MRVPLRFHAALALGFVIVGATQAQQSAPGGPPSPRQAVERALPLLQQSAQAWTRERKCASCHHQGLGPIAMAMARERGFRVDESMLRAELGAVRGSLASADAGVNLPANTNYIDDSLWLAAIGSVGDPRGRSTDLVVHRLLGGQHVDGHWIPYPFRPPIEGSLIANTAWAIRALRLFAPPAREQQVDAAIGRARDWVSRQTPLDTQDFAMKLLALHWSGDRIDRNATETAGQLIALQRADGGWGQIPSRTSDAYATGQALVALNQAADLRPTDAAFAKGAAFLTRSQHTDGSWLVETRRTWRRGIPYAESGFPHGKHQFISYAGAAWATMALVLADRHAQSDALSGHVATRASTVPLAAIAGSDNEISTTLTPLMRGALFGSVDDMRSVLKDNPDVNATATKLGITALMCAAHDADKVRLLVDAGANVRAATSAGHTALLVAADHAGAAESVRLLLRSGADPNIRTKAFLATPLARATLHGDRAVAALLLDAGAAVNDRPDGSVALLVAANQGDKDMVRLLLDRGADIESHPMATVPITNGEQLPTPLMLAADRGWHDIVTLLLSRRANVNARDRQGMTPLMYAAGAIQTGVNSASVIETLLAARADIDARAANGDTALDLAERYGNEPVVAVLKAAQRLAPSAQRMDEVVRFYADAPQPAFMGVVLVARGSEVLFVKGYGMANLAWSLPHTPTTRFAIGSNSKQFTAAAILLLEERGKLRLTDPIKSYLPDAPAAWDAITFHHLLSHTSGLLNTAPAERGLVLPARPDRTIERFRNLPLQSAPGTKYSYSNAGYQLLAYLIERTSGQRYEEFLRENIFEPLGMKESGSAGVRQRAWRRIPQRTVLAHRGAVALPTRQERQ